MGGIWTYRGQLLTTLSEVVGYKSGLALTRDELLQHVPEDDRGYIDGHQTETIRIRADVFEDLVSTVLYSLGNTNSPSNIPATILLSHKYKHDAVASSLLGPVIDAYTNWVFQALETATPGEKTLDPPPVFHAVLEEHGPIAAKMLIELLRGTNDDLHRSPWGRIRHVDWQDVQQLRDLFNSQNLETQYGSFLDQRFIDYLERNNDDVAQMNWRKFEALTCEFFDQAGFHVEIGPGRNDDGVDARIWSKQEDASGPALVLVQCKREKSDVPKTVVKALWADLQEENAPAGLVVTSSRVSPGAKAVKRARGYNIRFAERDTVHSWLAALRSPDRGLFFDPDQD